MTKKQTQLWACPDCGREFAKRNQWHSCRARSVDSHFRGKDPRLQGIYEVLIARLKECGELRVDAVESSINLASTYHFAGIAVRREYLRLGFVLDEKLDHERIVKTEPLGGKRVGHSVILRSPDEVDSQLMRWLKRAYAHQSG